METEFVTLLINYATDFEAAFKKVNSYVSDEVQYVQAEYAILLRPYDKHHLITFIIMCKADPLKFMAIAKHREVFQRIKEQFEDIRKSEQDFRKAEEYAIQLQSKYPDLLTHYKPVYVRNLKAQ